MEEKIKNIILEYKTSSNKDLETTLEFLTKDFNETKEMLITLTKHLDGVEQIYNKILSEYKSRKPI
jgi:hypothetical protein